MGAAPGRDVVTAGVGREYAFEPVHCVSDADADASGETQHPPRDAVRHATSRRRWCAWHALLGRAGARLGWASETPCVARRFGRWTKSRGGVGCVARWMWMPGRRDRGGTASTNKRSASRRVSSQTVGLARTWCPSAAPRKHKQTDAPRPPPPAPPRPTRPAPPAPAQPAPPRPSPTLPAPPDPPRTRPSNNESGAVPKDGPARITLGVTSGSFSLPAT